MELFAGVGRTKARWNLALASDVAADRQRRPIAEQQDRVAAPARDRDVPLPGRLLRNRALPRAVVADLYQRPTTNV